MAASRHRIPNPSTVLLAFLAVAVAAAFGRDPAPRLIAPDVRECFSRNRACAMADIDGDHGLDMAYPNTRAFGRQISGATVRLSGHGAEQHLDLTRWPAASGLSLRDVDGDADRDLIVTTGSHHAVAVFLNDGHGAFAFSPDEYFLVAADSDDGLEFAPPPHPGGRIGWDLGNNSPGSARLPDARGNRPHAPTSRLYRMPVRSGPGQAFLSSFPTRAP